MAGFKKAHNIAITIVCFGGGGALKILSQKARLVLAVARDQDPRLAGEGASGAFTKRNERYLYCRALGRSDAAWSRFLGLGLG